MDDNTSKASSSLVVQDKNAHKPGGCVGIFCKLFDWNRRFAKKKLFPKKLLAPARGNKVSKKFNPNENLLKTKHLLTDNANGGGMPKKNGSLVKHEMKSPGLVARLMGLDSMPVVKPQSADKSPFGKQEVANLGKGRLRNGIQPQKIHKTGLFERRPVNNRFGAEALQIRNVLSRSKKRHHKLASPVKSPRIVKSKSRLIDAATRILEPGLQATSRAKCALTYSNSVPQQTMSDEVMRGAKTVITLPSSSCNVEKPKDLKAQSSCQNCGHALGTQDLTNGAIEQNPHKAFFPRDSEVVLLRSRNQPEDLTETIFQGVPFSLNGKKHCGLHESSFLPHQRDPSPLVTREDRVPPRSTMEKMHKRRVSSTTAFNDKKDFIAMSRNVSQTQFRLPRKPHNCAEIGRQYQVSQDDASSNKGNILTKGIAGVFRHVEHVECSSSSSSIMDREKSLESELMEGSRIRFDGNLAYPTCVNSQLSARGGNVLNRSKDIDNVSGSFCPTQMDHMRMDQSNFINGEVSGQRLVKEGNQRVKSVSSLMMNEDALGTLLVKKLKELTCLGENESVPVTPQGRTATVILQELISALTVERPVSPEFSDSLSSDPAIMYGPSQADAGGKRLSVRFSGNHFSPGSILDASFSNDSCVSSSIDDNSGNMLQSDFMDLSTDDSESSYNNREIGSNVPIIHLLDHISAVLDKITLPDMRLSTAYSGYTKEVLLNAELLFGNANGPETVVDFLVGPFLDELETLANAAWRNTIISGFQEPKGGSVSPLRRFLFDCLVECLSVRYDRYTNSGFIEWHRLPRQLNVDALIRIFDYEVRKSASMAEMTLDEIIDWEMNASLSKWTDLEMEVLASGAEIGLIIFQGLVDEIVSDFMLS